MAAAGCEESDVATDEAEVPASPLRAPWIIVAAATPAHGIGLRGGVPWRLPGDLAFFKRLTMLTTRGAPAVNAVLMGRRTWESLPGRPLRGRLNIVLTSGPAVAGALTARSLADAERLAREHDVENVLVIGGGRVYEDVLRSGLADAACITRVAGYAGDVDTYMPAPLAYGLVRVTPAVGSELERAAQMLQAQADGATQGLTATLECYLHWQHALAIA